MPLITSRIPDQWGDLEDLVAGILKEAGLNARRRVAIILPPGCVNGEMLAEEIHDKSLGPTGVGSTDIVEEFAPLNPVGGPLRFQIELPFFLSLGMGTKQMERRRKSTR
jgi:hypothetical protein